MKKIVCCFMVALLAICTFAGCSRDGMGVKLDPKRTQIYVGTSGSGIGREWLSALAARFEAFYAEESFESGKTGVQIMPVLIPPINSSQISLIDEYKCDLFFAENTEYYAFVKAKKTRDITTAVTENLTDFGEEGNIENKLTAIQQNFYKIDGSAYHGLPFAQGRYGIVYDLDLFEAKSLYFAKGGAKSEYTRPENALSGEWDGDYRFTGTGEKSAGPDGEYGTWDDGTPATYDEFFVMCDRMIDRNVQPMTWAGKFPSTINYLMAGLLADYEGSEQMMLNFDFEGQATSLGQIVDGNFVFDAQPTDIFPSNGYELARQAGRYYALSFVERLLSSSDYYDTLSFSPAQTHKDAQADFLYSRFNSDADTKPIAMLIDGEWWTNEAAPVFESMSKRIGQHTSLKNRKFGMLPLPKATIDKVGEPFSFYDTLYTLMFAGAAGKAPAEAVKKLIQFAHTDVSLQEFLNVTSFTKPFTLNLTKQQKEDLPHFAKSVINTQENGERIYPISTSAIYKAAAISTFDVLTIFASKVNSIDRSVPITEMKNNNISAAQYFSGLAAYRTPQWWHTKFGAQYEN